MDYFNQLVYHEIFIARGWGRLSSAPYNTHYESNYATHLYHWLPWWGVVNIIRYCTIITIVSIAHFSNSTSTSFSLSFILSHSFDIYFALTYSTLSYLTLLYLVCLFCSHCCLSLSTCLLIDLLFTYFPSPSFRWPFTNFVYHSYHHLLSFIRLFIFILLLLSFVHSFVRSSSFCYTSFRFSFVF